MTDEDTEDNVEIISATEDEKIKLIGEIFSNDSSRKILKLISNGTEMTANEIAQKNYMSLTLVAHHLRRMQTARMVKITRTGRSVKGHDMKYYLATNQSFLITPPEKTPYIILASLKKFSKFAAIGMAGLVSWMALKPDVNTYQMQPTHGPGQTDFTSAEKTVIDQRGERSSSESKPEVRVEDTDVSMEPMNSREDVDVWSSGEQIPEPPSHSGVQNFDLQANLDTGSISLDRTVYPEPFGVTGVESVEPFIFSIIIPFAVVVGGIILERVLTRWFSKRERNKIVNS